MSKERTVLITGVLGKIGSATADCFVKQGWKVLGVDKNLPLNDDARMLKSDISRTSEILKIKNWVENQTQVLDCIVHNAAEQICKPFTEMKLEEWDLTFSTNLKAPFFLTQELFPLLRASEAASVVCISSVHSLATSRNISAYASSKGALSSLTRALALELAEYNIRVNAVCPGATQTAMLDAGLTRGHAVGDSIEEKRKGLALKHPLKRIGKPEEIARAIFFLACNESASFITGQSLIVDGGAMARLSTE